MRREEVLPLRRKRIDIAALTCRVEETKTGEPLKPQVAAEGIPEIARPWVSASETSASGHIHNPQHLYEPDALAGGAKFWFHAMHNCFITVAERDLMLLRALKSFSGWWACLRISVLRCGNTRRNAGRQSVIS